MKRKEEIHIDKIKWDISHYICNYIQSRLSAEEHGTRQTTAPEIYQMIKRPPEKKMGDFAVPCFSFAKLLRKNPKDIPNDIMEALGAQQSVKWIKRMEAVGPFLNIHIDHAQLANFILPNILSGQFFTVLKDTRGAERAKVMIEYSQPNTHKIFHVGHMRNVALGDSLIRFYEYLGDQVIAVNYIGDEGTHIAKCIWYIKKHNLTPPEEKKGDWLGMMYCEATKMLESAALETRAEYEREVSEVLRQIESKSGKLYDYWQESKEWSMAIFNEIYRWLGARFDYFFTESEVSLDSQDIVGEYHKKGVFVESDGAIGIDLKEHKLGFAILRKSDGNTIYAAKDLALARIKFEKYQVDRSIYVVGNEQQLHFKQVFKTLELMGFEKAVNCYHLNYGLVMLADGKMSSRAGNIIAFDELKNQLSKELFGYLEKYKDQWSSEEINDVNHKLCVGAIKYGMLCSDPAKDIIFNLTDWLSFEGDTGPYLMYSYARTKSIIQKAKEQNFSPDTSELTALVASEECDLIRYLYDFNEVVYNACRAHKPSILTHYLFDMCKAFNRFHSNIPVLKADTEGQRKARLALIECFSKVLKTGLNLIGIEPPERM